MVSAGGAAEQSVGGHKNVTRGSVSVFASYGIIPSTSLQPRKGGDMACVRGPLGAFCFIYNMIFFNLESVYLVDWFLSFAEKCLSSLA